MPCMSDEAVKIRIKEQTTKVSANSIVIRWPPCWFSILCDIK